LSGEENNEAKLESNSIRQSYQVLSAVDVEALTRNCPESQRQQLINLLQTQESLESSDGAEAHVPKILHLKKPRLLMGANYKAEELFDVYGLTNLDSVAIWFVGSHLVTVYILICESDGRFRRPPEITYPILSHSDEV